MVVTRCGNKKRKKKKTTKSKYSVDAFQSPFRCLRGRWTQNNKVERIFFLKNDRRIKSWQPERSGKVKKKRKKKKKNRKKKNFHPEDKKKRKSSVAVIELFEFSRSQTR